MTDVYRGSIIVLMMMILLVITACGPTQTAVRDYTPEADLTGLELDESEAPLIVYARPGAPDLDAYNRFIIDAVTFRYDDPKMKELSTEDVGKMQQYLRDAVIKELRDAGYEVGTKSKAGTMRVSFTISGLTAPTAIPNVTAAMAPIALSVGSVTIESVFREAVSGRIDGVAVSRSQGSRVLNPTPWSTWSDVRAGFRDWAKGFRQAVDEAHGR